MVTGIEAPRRERGTRAFGQIKHSVDTQAAPRCQPLIFLDGFHTGVTKHVAQDRQRLPQPPDFREVQRALEHNVAKREPSIGSEHTRTLSN